MGEEVCNLIPLSSTPELMSDFNLMAFTDPSHNIYSTRKVKKIPILKGTFRDHIATPRKSNETMGNIHPPQ